MRERAESCLRQPFCTRPHSTRTIPCGLNPKSAALPLRPRTARALLRLRISRVSSRALPPRPKPPQPQLITAHMLTSGRYDASGESHFASVFPANRRGQWHFGHRAGQSIYRGLVAWPQQAWQFEAGRGCARAVVDTTCRTVFVAT